MTAREGDASENLLADSPLTSTDWSVLSSAIDWYKRGGFQYVEVPWAVPSHVVSITLPPTRRAFGVIEDGRKFENALVGSAEQSFLHLTLKGRLDLGQENDPRSYVTASPCFRDDHPDTLHQKQFMKVELFEPYYMTTPDAYLDVRLGRMIGRARGFFLNYIPEHNLELVKTDEGWDITGNGVELGSYGIRTCRLLGTTLDVFAWVYGTGVAEPRLSQVRGMQ